MKDSIGALLLAVAASALVYTASATNKACINGHSQIVQLVCDGVDYTSRLTSPKNYKHCDCIDLPICKRISINAKGHRGQQSGAPGVQFCQSSRPTAFRDWVCASALHTKGDWANAPYDVSTWKAAHKPKGKCARCHKRRYLPCRSKCFWNKGIPAPAVNCVREQCEDECISCQQSGPGNCDPGMCRLSSNVNTLTQETHCNRQCRVDWKAWGQSTSPTGSGYIKLTDTRSQSVDIFQANQAGYYIAVIDFTTCTFLTKNYTEWMYQPFNVLKYGLLLSWYRDANGPMKNMIAVDMGVGGSSSDRPPKNPSSAPSMATHLLGTNTINYLVNTGHHCATTAVFTGINNGHVNLTSYTVTADIGTC